jgi:hypothetical protein
VTVPDGGLCKGAEGVRADFQMALGDDGSSLAFNGEELEGEVLMKRVLRTTFTD